MKEPKLKTVYVCSNCGETSPRWMGRCPSCGSWNTMNEDVVAEAPKAGTPAARQAAAAGQEGVTTPVYYTHLDVYKRQVSTTGCGSGSGSGATTDEAGDSVSSGGTMPPTGTSSPGSLVQIPRHSAITLTVRTDSTTARSVCFRPRLRAAGRRRFKGSCFIVHLFSRRMPGQLIFQRAAIRSPISYRPGSFFAR